MQIKETFLNLTKTYQNAINRLEKLFDPEFEKAVKLINSSDGHIVVCGMGKSGLVGRKISATLASTGTPSYFLHPGEAIHGDLGIVQSKSIIIFYGYCEMCNLSTCQNCICFKFNPSLLSAEARNMVFAHINAVQVQPLIKPFILNSLALQKGEKNHNRIYSGIS